MAAKPKTADSKQSAKPQAKPINLAPMSAEVQPWQEPLESVLQRAEMEPTSITPDDAKRIQRSIGNQAFGQLQGMAPLTPTKPKPVPAVPANHSLQTIVARTAVLTQKSSKNKTTTKTVSKTSKRKVIQPKLQVNQVDDPLEREADKVAEDVLKKPLSASAPPPADDANKNSASNPIQRQADSSNGNPALPRVEARVTGINGKISPLANTLLAKKSGTNKAAVKPGKQTSKRKTIQLKLQVDEADSLQEKEASETAAKMPISTPTPPPADDEDENGTATVQRKADTLGGGTVTPDVESRITNLQGRGTPLPDDKRTVLEDRMGADFSNIRVHTSSNAVQLSQDLNARAFTVGKDIAFNEGEYSPDTTGGQKLLAHELTHTVQQGAAGKIAPKPQIQRQEDPAAVEDEGPTDEEKAVALAAAEAAAQEANSVRAASHAQANESRVKAGAEKEAGTAPQEAVAASLAEGPIQDGEQKAQEAAVAQTALNATELMQQEVAEQTQPTDETAGEQSPADETAPPAESPAPVGAVEAETAVPANGSDPAAATTNAQTAVETAFAAAENPPDKAPDSSESDPAFQNVVTEVNTVAAEQQTHEPAAGAASRAQDAVVIPAAEISSRAQTGQVGDMETVETPVVVEPVETPVDDDAVVIPSAETNSQVSGIETIKTPGFNAAGFKAALMARIAELAPKTAKEADDFKEDNALGGVQADMQGRVSQERANTAAPLAEATATPPDTGAVEVRPATPLAVTDPGPAPAIAGAANAAPSPRSTSEVEAPVAAGSQSIDQQMQAANITEDQLARSNEPGFTSALAAREEAQTAAAETPQAARQEESDLIATARGDAVNTATTALGDMHAQRTVGQTAVTSQQTETMSKDEQARAKVAADITAIYDRTQTKVNSILTNLDTKVIGVFDAGAEEAKQAFENYVDAKMEAYKEKRYGGDWGWAKWIKDKLLGMPAEVNAFFNEGRQLYLGKMEAVIDNVVALIGRTLAEAKAEVAKGKQEIQIYVDKLPEELQTVGQDAAQEIQGRFDELTEQIDDKQNELVDTLAQKYNDNLQAIDSRIEEMKAANRGLVNKAIDAIGGAIKTILELKDMLLEVLADMADAVMAILQDPIGFIKNFIKAVGQGLNNFVSNIAKHLQTGLLQWLTGTMGGIGIQIPDDLFSFKGIFSLVTQILGVTWNQIRTRAVTMLGEPIVNALETGFEIFMVIKNEGLAGLWEYIKEHIGNLKDTVIDSIKDMLINQVIKAGVQWLVGLLGGPAGVFAKAAKAIYDIVMWFSRNAKRIMSLLQAITKSVSAVAAGNLSAAADYFEDALARFIPMAIGFLASLLGIGNLADKVRKIIDKVKKPIQKAIDWLLKKAKKVAKRIARALGLKMGGEKKEDGRTGDGEVGDTIKFAADGESHKLWYNVQGTSATLMVASTPELVEDRIRQWEASLRANKEMLGEKRPRAVSLIANAKDKLGIADKEGDEAAKEKQKADKDQKNDQQETKFEQADQEAEQAEQTVAEILRELFELFGAEQEEVGLDDKEIGKTQTFKGGDKVRRLWIKREGSTGTVMVADQPVYALLMQENVRELKELDTYDRTEHLARIITAGVGSLLEALSQQNDEEAEKLDEIIEGDMESLKACLEWIYIHMKDHVQNEYKAVPLTDDGSAFEGRFEDFPNWTGYPTNVTGHPINHNLCGLGSALPKPTGKYMIPSQGTEGAAPISGIIRKWRNEIDAAVDEIVQANKGKDDTELLATTHAPPTMGYDGDRTRGTDKKDNTDNLEILVAKAEATNAWRKIGYTGLDNFRDLKLLGSHGDDHDPWQAHHIHEASWGGTNGAKNYKFMIHSEHEKVTTFWEKRKKDITDAIVESDRQNEA